jgi:hypothetical protein
MSIIHYTLVIERTAFLGSFFDLSMLIYLRKIDKPNSSSLVVCRRGKEGNRGPWYGHTKGFSLNYLNR